MQIKVDIVVKFKGLSVACHLKQKDLASDVSH